MAQKSNLTIEVLSIIGGVLTAIFFLGFLVLSSILRSETSCLITGSILIITTLFVNRLLTKPFLDAMNITCYIAGCILAGYGMNRNMDVLFIVLIGISVVTMLLSKGFILTFLSVISFYMALFGEITNLFSSLNPLNVAAVPIIAIFLFVNLSETKILSYTNGDFSKYKPIHSGLFVSCVLSLAGLSVNYLTKSTNDWIISVFMLVGILLMVYKIVQVMQVKSPVHQVCIYLLCILICFVPVIFYSMGISSWVFNAVTTPIFMVAIAENIEAVANGGVPMNIATSEAVFTAALITMGGRGGTLPLNVLMLGSKSKKLKTMGKICIGPSLFNINEPLMFGAPVVFNPLLMLPILINSIVGPTVVWLTMHYGLLNIPSKMVQVGQIPAPFSSVMITGDWRAVPVYIVLFILYLLTWYPFYKVYERQCVEEETQAAC